jgi:uncharacterized protein YceK
VGSRHRPLTLSILIAVILSGCANTMTRTGVSELRTPTLTATVPAPRSSTHGSGPSRVSLDPLSGGTECVVSYRGAFVVFKSSGYDVTPACSAQIRAGATVGERWSYPTGGQVAGNRPVCTLTTAMAMATVYDADDDDDVGRRVCRRLLGAGWAQA